MSDEPPPVPGDAAPDAPVVEPSLADPVDPAPKVEPDALADPPRPAERATGFRRILRRFGPAVVAIGAAVFASPLADQWPSTHAVELALDHPDEVRSVSLSIAPHGEGDPIFATSWSFESGQAPPRLQTQLSTPSGAYDATIVTVREAGAREEIKRVDLDGNRITLFAR